MSMNIKQYIKEVIAKVGGEDGYVKEDVAEILDISEVFKNIDSRFLTISGNFSKLSSTAKPKEILNSIIEDSEVSSEENRNAVWENSSIWKNLRNAEIALENILDNIFELEIAVLCKQKGHILQYDLVEVNINISDVRALMVIITNNVNRLVSEPWWNNPQNEIQAIYCEITEACKKFLTATNELKKYDNGILIEEL